MKTEGEAGIEGAKRPRFEGEARIEGVSQDKICGEGSGEGFGEPLPENFCKIESEMVQSGAYFNTSKLPDQAHCLICHFVVVAIH